MPEGALLLAFITLQRLAELGLARRNTRRLLAAGGVELGRAHYPLIVALHAAWLGGLWFLAYDHMVDPVYLAAFILLQFARAWVIASLGRRWTTRIVVVPGEPLVKRGPYRFLRHPNYLVVAGEIAVVPLALGEPAYAAAFSVLNALVLALRVRCEDAALMAVAGGPVAAASDAPARGDSGGPLPAVSRPSTPRAASPAAGALPSREGGDSYPSPRADAQPAYRRDGRRP